MARAEAAAEALDRASTGGGGLPVGMIVAASAVLFRAARPPPVARSPRGATGPPSRGGRRRGCVALRRSAHRDAHAARHAAATRPDRRSTDTRGWRRGQQLHRHAPD
ncbi:MAG: hypothetical protein R2695_09910 [Acidimicrobiales bacterium]